MSRNSLPVSLALMALLTPSLVGGDGGGVGIIDDPRIVLRGDANNDLSVDVSDAVFLCNFLFRGGMEPPCMNQADANDDGVVDISDPVTLVVFLFIDSSHAIAPPGPHNFACKPDLTKPWLDCEGFLCGN